MSKTDLPPEGVTEDIAPHPKIGSNEFEQQKIDFLQVLDSFFQSCGKKLQPVNINGKVVDLYLLYSAVTARRGYKAVNKRNLWSEIITSLPNFGIEDIQLAPKMRKCYKKLLYSFEKACLGTGVFQDSDLLKSESASSTPASPAPKKTQNRPPRFENVAAAGLGKGKRAAKRSSSSKGLGKGVPKKFFPKRSPSKTGRPNVEHYLAYCDDNEDVGSIMKKFALLEKADTSRLDEFAKLVKTRVPPKETYTINDGFPIEATETAGYAVEDGLDTMKSVYGYYEKIDSYAPAVDGEERELIMKKLETSKHGGCRSQSCCANHGPISHQMEEEERRHAEMLRELTQSSEPAKPVDSAKETPPSEKLCACRKRGVECDNHCACAISSTPCKNRSIQQKKMKVLGEDIVEAPLKGIDPYSRQNMLKALPENMRIENKDFFAEALVTAALRKRCAEGVPDTSLVAALRDVMNECEKAKQERKPQHTVQSSNQVVGTITTTATNPDGSRALKRQKLGSPDLKGDDIGTLNSTTNKINGMDLQHSKENLKRPNGGHLESQNPSKIQKILPNQSTSTEPVVKEKWYYADASRAVYTAAVAKPTDFLSHPKGIGVLVKREEGLAKHEYLGEYIGELYPAWRWFEREHTMKNVRRAVHENAPVLPEFYNMMLERHDDDELGYDLVFVDPKRKGNFTSRISHSCNPNAMVTVVASGSRYSIAVYTVREIKKGEEITFDYHCRTDSKDELKEAVCLCGTTSCRGSYLYYSDEDAFDRVLHRDHSFVHRTAHLLNADRPELNEDEKKCLAKHNCKASLLTGLPVWGQKYAASVCSFIQHEAFTLPKELMKQVQKPVNTKQAAQQPGTQSINTYTMSNAIDDAEAVRRKRIQCLAISLDKIKYFLRHQNVKHSPLRVLPVAEVIERLWSRQNSLVNQLAIAISPHIDAHDQLRLEQIIAATQNVPKSQEGMQIVQKSLIQVRDFLRQLVSNKGAKHDAAADLVHLFINTVVFFEERKFKPFKSVYAEIGVCADGSGRGVVEHKDYSSEYCWAQLDTWFKESSDSLSSRLPRARQGCVLLPDIQSCYAKERNGSLRAPYSRFQRQSVLNCLYAGASAEVPSWPSGLHFTYRNTIGLMGSPVLDQALGVGDLAKCVRELAGWKSKKTSSSVLV